jgi:hypothetical protein
MVKALCASGRFSWMTPALGFSVNLMNVDFDMFAELKSLLIIENLVETFQCFHSTSKSHFDPTHQERVAGIFSKLFSE